MREYAFQLPTPLYREQADAINAALFALAGGFSTTEVSGHWRDPHTGKVYIEPMTEVRVAVAGRPGNVGDLCQLAMQTARNMGEKALYWRGPNGEVFIITL